jgi:hypothetical protein
LLVAVDEEYEEVVEVRKKFGEREREPVIDH